jgi:hypothetical protein
MDGGGCICQVQPNTSATAEAMSPTYEKMVASNIEPRRLSCHVYSPILCLPKISSALVRQRAMVLGRGVGACGSASQPGQA